MKTGLKDFNGHNIHEGDYVRLVLKEFREGSVDWHEPLDKTEMWSEIGRVVWDTRRNSWQVMRMRVPNANTEPSLWGTARVDWLGEYNSKCYELVLDGGYVLANDTEFRAYKKLKGDWHPKTFFSDGVEVPYTTYKKAHKKEEMK